jgi:hypothetical protein
MARPVDYGDPEELKKGGGNFIGRYKAEANRKDRIRIISSCYAYKVHWIQESGRYCLCGRDDDGQGTCIVCDEKDGAGAPKYPPTEKYGTLIVWVGKWDDHTKDWANVQQTLFWGFGNDKYKTLSDIAEEIGDLKQRDLIITCKDTQFQDLNIRTAADDTRVDKETLRAQLPNAKRCFEIYMSPPTLEKQKEALGIAATNAGVAESLPEQTKPTTTDAGQSIQDEVDEMLADLGGL